MKCLSIVFVAAIALVSCGSDVADACACQEEMNQVEADSLEAWKADEANAACVAAMELEGALDSCGVAEVDTMNDFDTAAVYFDTVNVDVPNDFEPALRDDTDIKTPTEVGRDRQVPRSQNDNENF